MSDGIDYVIVFFSGRSIAYNSAIALIDNISHVEVEQSIAYQDYTDDDTDNISALEWIKNEKYRTDKKNNSENQLEYLQALFRFLGQRLYDLNNCDYKYDKTYNN